MLEDLMEDKAFLAKIEAADNMEEIKKMFNEKGYEIDLDALQSVIATEQGELNENDLEHVAGGYVKPIGRTILKWLINVVKGKSRTSSIPVFRRNK